MGTISGMALGLTACVVKTLTVSTNRTDTQIPTHAGILLKLKIARIRSSVLLFAKPLHSGADFAADYGTNVLAVANGIVLDCSYDAAYGYILTLEHENGVQTQYAHLSEFLVNAGAEVRQGQIIAKTGDSGWTTGPHLHLGVLIDGEAVDPLETLKSE